MIIGSYVILTKLLLHNSRSEFLFLEIFIKLHVVCWPFIRPTQCCVAVYFCTSCCVVWSGRFVPLLVFIFDQLMKPQKGEKKKKKKKGSNMDTLQEQRKNKKEMEFELKLAKEKEEMYEREKQLKISRLVQEVSETEREDLEESEKVQHWVERLCQTRLEQISCVENDSPEVQSETSVKTSLHSELFSNVSLFLHKVILRYEPISFYFGQKMNRALIQ